MGAAPLEGHAVRRLACLIVAAWALGLPALALEPNAVSEEPTQVVIVVVGAPGTDIYQAQFTQAAQRWKEGCARGKAKFISLGLEEDPDETDRARLKQILASQAKRSDTHTLWLVLIGHGTFDGRHAKFNLRGPDVTATELAHWLAPIRVPMALINCASSSSPFLKKLSAANRVVITATKSGFERNVTRFAGDLAKAILEPEADLDKDGQTSLLEAYLSAAHHVVEFYRTGGRLVTEHALLDDTGDGLGTPADWFRGIHPKKKAADNASLDGYRAHQFHLIPSQSEAGFSMDLRADRNRLELEIMQLREQKAEIPAEIYYERLEPLLYQIAEIYEQVDEPNDEADE